MRLLSVIIAGTLLTGCASQEPQTTPPANTPPVAVASAGLVFDPPITMNDPEIDLSRATRGPAAFVGFEDTTTSYFSIQSDDRRTVGLCDWYVRDASVGKFGSIRR